MIASPLKRWVSKYLSPLLTWALEAVPVGLVVYMEQYYQLAPSLESGIEFHNPMQVDTIQVMQTCRDQIVTVLRYTVVASVNNKL